MLSICAAKKCSQRSSRGSNERIAAPRHHPEALQQACTALDASRLDVAEAVEPYLAAADQLDRALAEHLHATARLRVLLRTTRNYADALVTPPMIEGTTE
jgi:hypothetical protein